MPTSRNKFKVGDAVTVSGTVHHGVGCGRVCIHADGERDFHIFNVPVEAVSRPVAVYQGQAPQIRVKSFKPAKFRKLAEEVLAAGLDAADPFGECNYNGSYQAPSERVRAALQPELVLAILPPARHKDYLHLLAFQVACKVAGDVDNPELNLLSEAEVKRLGDRYNSWLMSFACELEAVPG